MGWSSRSPEASSFLRQPSISETARPIAMLLTPPFESAVVESASSLHLRFSVKPSPSDFDSQQKAPEYYSGAATSIRL